MPEIRIQPYLAVCHPASSFQEATTTSHSVKMLGHVLAVTAVGNHMVTAERTAPDKRDQGQCRDHVHVQPGGGLLHLLSRAKGKEQDYKKSNRASL